MYQTIKSATLSGVGIYRFQGSGTEVLVWKIRTLTGKVFYENSDRARFASVRDLMKGTV